MGRRRGAPSTARRPPGPGALGDQRPGLRGLETAFPFEQKDMKAVGLKQSAKKLIVVSSNNHHQLRQNFTASLVRFPDSAYANFRPINCATWTIVIHEHCLLAALLAGELKKLKREEMLCYLPLYQDA